MSDKFKKTGQSYQEEQLQKLGPIIKELGFELDAKQVHISGERYLSTGQKLVLVAKRIVDGQRVIIKVANDQASRAEIDHERNCRLVLAKVNFAYHIFYSPAEILYLERGGITFFVTEFIAQSQPFLDRELPEQFWLALKSFEAQAGVHATTYEHASLIKQTFGMWHWQDYLDKLDGYNKDLQKNNAEPAILKVASQARSFFAKNKGVVDLYSDFLTHWDFVPHNLRIRDNDIYLLDHSSIRFGNKYESWARFINFMVLYKPALAEALLAYVRDNRPVDEYLSLQTMRVFRLYELIWHYVKTLDKTTGDHKELNQKRIKFWAQALAAVLDNRILDPAIISQYKKVRDSLRTIEEKQRQIGLH